jgi:hypothetical protein
MRQQVLPADQGVALPGLDRFDIIISARVARYRAMLALFTLRLAMMAAEGLASGSASFRARL